MVLRKALLLVALGLAIGVPVSLLGTRLMRTQLYGIRTYDPLTFTCGISALSFFAALAGFIPARRAASLEPMNALRAE
jgi:ABC-type antimicrobial peptide transport system permease subunit